MRNSQRQFRAVGAGLALLGVAACAKPATPPDDLSQDLASLTAKNDLALSPSAGRTDVVSTVEQAAPKVPASAPSQRVVSYRSTAPKSPAVAPAATTEPSPPSPVSESHTTPSPAPVPDVVQPRPAARPTPQGNGTGGWGTVGDVIRNAPFPINP